MTNYTDNAEDYLRSKYGAYRGHFAWRELEEAFNAGRTSLAPAEAPELTVAEMPTTENIAREAFTEMYGREPDIDGSDWDWRGFRRGWVARGVALPLPAQQVAKQEPIQAVGYDKLAVRALAKEIRENPREISHKEHAMMQKAALDPLCSGCAQQVRAVTPDVPEGYAYSRMIGGGVDHDGKHYIDYRYTKPRTAAIQSTAGGQDK